MAPNHSATRLFVIQARSAPTAVILRRGPSKQVQLIKWNTADDSFEPGQWLKGRIYERRCDLAPDGELLIYFAAKNKAPLYSWTAISRPPYLTALALWPNGSTWGGGGHFLSNTQVELNQCGWDRKLANDFTIPKWLKVKPFRAPDRAHFDPIWAARLRDDGWQQTNSGTKTKDDFGAKVLLEFAPPITWERKHPKFSKRYSLELSLLGIKEQNGPWYVTENSIYRHADDDVEHLGRTDWADWSHEGDLLFAQAGRLYRVSCDNGKLASVNDAVEIADLRENRFTEMVCPEKLQRWPRR